ncbi:helix-turn-helix transcriptional regulator [Leeuwenhoekiella marinoflava]|uniref:helix-turn-helix domain-containing protein n=1 Tax=Leeuwenhoekiella marinoflava TaxID=988 RepID=UPI003001A583
MVGIVSQIKKLRGHKGYSQDYMAYELDISQAAYAKLEKNETKLTVDRLFRISEILETSIYELLRFKASSINNTGQNFHKEQPDVVVKLIEQYEERLKEKDEFIAILKERLY